MQLDVLLDGERVVSIHDAQPSSLRVVQNVSMGVYL
jgi:hypothetical protein